MTLKRSPIITRVGHSCCAKTNLEKKNIVNVIFNKKEYGKGDVVFLNLYNQC
jgi:hypothetical protein